MKLLARSPKPHMSKGRGQTKRSPLFLQVGGCAFGLLSHPHKHSPHKLQIKNKRLDKQRRLTQKIKKDNHLNHRKEKFRPPKERMHVRSEYPQRSKDQFKKIKKHKN
jgi:hypothetical protein